MCDMPYAHARKLKPFLHKSLDLPLRWHKKMVT